MLHRGGNLTRILAWDIGGANIKAARVFTEDGAERRVLTVCRPYEIWREKDRLMEVLREIHGVLFPSEKPEAFAVTMTAELSDVFATKREGVAYVLENIRASYPDPAIYVLSLSGEFARMEDALLHPLDYAASNWLALANWVSATFPDCLLVDVGSTTTDLLPIREGRVCVAGRTDMARLASGELIFTGALRTNLAAIVKEVPVAGRMCRVAAEYFAVSGDVHLLTGHLLPQHYTCSTPDGQPPSVDSARRRIARLVCADTEMLPTDEIHAMAQYIHAQQVNQICDGLRQVLERMPELRNHPVVVVGMGEFLGLAAAENMNLRAADLQGVWNDAERVVMPCVAAAHLLEKQLRDGCI